MKRLWEGGNLPKGVGGPPKRRAEGGQATLPAHLPGAKGGGPATSLPALRPALVHSYPELVGAYRVPNVAKPWRSQKSVNSSTVNFGVYATREEAAAAHDMASIWLQLRD